MKKITFLVTIISATALYCPPLPAISSPDTTRLIYDMGDKSEWPEDIAHRADPDNSSVFGDNFKDSVAYQERELQLKKENLVFRCQAMQKQIETLLLQRLFNSEVQYLRYQI